MTKAQLIEEIISVMSTFEDASRLNWHRKTLERRPKDSLERYLSETINKANLIKETALDAEWCKTPEGQKALEISVLKKKEFETKFSELVSETNSKAQKLFDDILGTNSGYQVYVTSSHISLRLKNQVSYNIEFYVHVPWGKCEKNYTLDLNLPCYGGFDLGNASNEIHKFHMNVAKIMMRSEEINTRLRHIYDVYRVSSEVLRSNYELWISFMENQSRKTGQAVLELSA